MERIGALESRMDSCISNVLYKTSANNARLRDDEAVLLTMVPLPRCIALSVLGRDPHRF
jgi:hypothetical protein